MSLTSRSHIVIVLRRRYGHILGELAQCPDTELEADLAAIERVLLLFKPDEDLSTVRPIRPKAPNHTRWARHVLQCLKQANQPLTGRELTRMVMDRCEVPRTNFRLLKSIECAIHGELGRLEGRGVRQVSVEPKRWEAG